MASPEFGFINEPWREITQIGREFTGVDYSDDRRGYNNALSALKAQHARVKLALPPDLIRELVRRNDPIIGQTATRVVEALNQSAWADALRDANALYAYGDIAYKDFTGGEALDSALAVHRTFSGRLRERFGTTDPYLRNFVIRMDPEIAVLRQGGRKAEELELIRGNIHTVALNGTLGDEAKQYFDPATVLLGLAN